MRILRFLILSSLFLFVVGFTFPVFSNSSISDLDAKKKEIQELEQQLEKVKGEKQTLASTLNYLNSKIKLTEAEIQKTETELKLIKSQIAELSNKIAALDTSLQEVTNLLLNRINNTYKRSRINPLYFMFATNDFSEVLSWYKYLKTVQRNDRQIMYQMEVTRVDFNNQKQIKQQKQTQLNELNQELEKQQQSLASQQNEKQKLLEITKNDEKRFQYELDKKLAELEAIQSIIAGRGEETEVGSINENDVIAQVIPGPSTCSSGAHLHFEVAENGGHKNPADLLSPKSVIWDNAPDTPFSFSGSWSWPLHDNIRITQGYGMTFFASTLRYYGGAPHTGIDMVNNQNYQVKAVKSGTLFRGSIPCRGGTLRYVRVKHSESLSSYYLHVNY